MKVNTYVFQSPYPSAVQVGRPDPQAQESNEVDTSTISEAGNETKRDAQEYKAAVSTGSSVNVAVSSADDGVSGSLDEFTTLNSQTQASEAYSS